MAMLLQDAIKHDRTERRKMSRKAYAIAVGIRENRVHSLEYGRKLKPGELELLQSFIGDLLDPELTAATLNTETTPSEEHSPLEEQVQRDRIALGNDYLQVMHRLGDRIPPHQWPSQFRLETAPPVEFPAIREWIDQVRQWVAEQDGHVAGLTDLTSPTTPAPPVEVTTVDDFDDGSDDQDWSDNGADPIPPAPVLIPPQPMQFDGVMVPTSPAVVLDPELTYVTNGELQTFKDCQRRWYLTSYLELGQPVRKVTGPAAIGTRFHAALAVWYQPQPGDPWEQFNRGVQDDREMLVDSGASEDELKEFDSDVDLVRAMLEGYFAWVQETSADSGLTIIGPEQVISANPQFPEYPNHRLLAKLDVRVLNERDGSRLFVDHKTVSSFMEAIKTLHMDEQMLHYHLIEWLMIVAEGLDQQIRAAGAMYNMARKVKRTAQAHPPFFQREIVRHNLDQLQAYWRRVRATIRQIEEARSRLAAGEDHLDVVPPRPTRECYWKCEFYTVCPMMDDARARAQDYMNEQLVHLNHLQRYEPDAVGETV
jgi:hypothetical protein